MQICGKFQSLILGEHSFKDALHRNILGNVHNDIPNSIGLSVFYFFPIFSQLFLILLELESLSSFSARLISFLI